MGPMWPDLPHLKPPPGRAGVIEIVMCHVSQAILPCREPPCAAKSPRGWAALCSLTSSLLLALHFLCSELDSTESVAATIHCTGPRPTMTPGSWVVVVQSVSHVRLFVISWTAAHQASLSFTISQSLLKLMSIELTMPSNHLTLCHPFLLLPSIFSQHQGLFQWTGSSHQVAKVLELQLQHQPFQWIFRIDFFWGWLVWSPCSPRDFQESSPTHIHTFEL